MSQFHASAQEIRVEDDHILRASLTNMEGGQVAAEFDLNTCIGNNEGNFEWGGVNFSESAEDISFSLEGDDSVPILRASLRDSEGNMYSRDINLSERIGNNDGSFVFE